MRVLNRCWKHMTKDKVPIDTLNPKICPNCNEGNVQDAKFCAKCRMVLTYDAYNETVECQKEKESEVKNLKDKMRLLDVTFTLIGYIFDYLHGLHFAA